MFTYQKTPPKHQKHLKKRQKNSSVWGSESDDFGSLCASFSRENAPNSPIFSRKTAKNTPKSAKNGPKMSKMTQNASKTTQNASKTAKMGKNSADFLDLAIENGSAHHKIPVFRGISVEILAAKGEFEAFLR
jgi:S-adenosylmethionine hydrolase